MSAYVIMGHSHELPETRIVPPGCMLVVDYHSGEPAPAKKNWVDGFHKTPDLFLHPVENYKNIVKSISSTGSLAIYKEGDTYHDFEYELLIKWTRADIDELKKNEIKLNDSGIMAYPFKKIKPGEVFTDTGGQTYPILKDIEGYKPFYKKYIYNIEDSIDFLLNKFRMSVYPTHAELVEAVKTITIDPTELNMRISQSLAINSELVEAVKNIDDSLLNKRISDALPLPIFNIKIRQSELFEKMPGIYYNLVCRCRKGEGLLEETKIGKNISYSIRNNKRLTNKNMKKRLTSEAFLHRRPYIPNLNLRWNSKANKNGSLNRLKNQLYRDYPERIPINEANKTRRLFRRHNNSRAMNAAIENYTRSVGNEWAKGENGWEKKPTNT